MSEKVKCDGNKQEPIGYKRLHWENYLDLLDELENKSDDKTDNLGLEKDKEENEYLFFFQHPDFKYYVFNIFEAKDENGIVQTHKINFFGDIVVRDFSYYSDKIMTMQLVNAEEVLKNIQDAYLGKLIDTDCEYNSKEIFRLLWLPRVKKQMGVIIENNPSSKEIENYLELIEEIKLIYEDIHTEFPIFNRKYQLSDKHFKADDVQSFLRKDRSFGQYCKEKQKFTLNYLFKEICYILGRFFYDMEKELIDKKQKDFCERFSKDFLYEKNKDIKLNSLIKETSSYKKVIDDHAGKPISDIVENNTNKNEFIRKLNGKKNLDDPKIQDFLKTYYRLTKAQLPDTGQLTKKRSK